MTQPAAFVLSILLAMLAGCGGGGATSVKALKPVEPLADVRSPVGPAIKGPAFDYLGQRVIVAMRAGTPDGAAAPVPAYSIGSADRLNWISARSQLAYVDGVGIVVPHVYMDGATDARYMLYDPNARSLKPLPKVRQLLTVGQPLEGGRADRMLIVWEDEHYYDRAEIRNRAGQVEHAWEDLARTSDDRFVHHFGAFHMIFPLTDDGERLMQIIDPSLNPIGPPHADIYELPVAVEPGKTQHKLFFGQPIAGEKNLYQLLQQDGRFSVPPGVVGLSPVGLNDQAPGSRYDAAAWLVLYDTAQGRRWGYADTNFTKVSGPLWSAVKRLPGPQMAILHTGRALHSNSKAPARAYVVVQDAAAQTWHALMPEYPFRAITPTASPSAEQAVALAEQQCAQQIAGLRQAEADRLAAVERKKQEAAQRRIAGGQTAEKDRQWQDALNHANWGFGGDLHNLAKRLGGVYWVDWIEHRGIAASPADLRNASTTAAAFDPERSQKLAAVATAAEKRQAELARLDEAARRKAQADQAASANRPPSAAINPGSSSYTPPTTYDYRTGVRSDTQQLQDWTYGRQNWKPASR